MRKLVFKSFFLALFMIPVAIIAQNDIMNKISLAIKAGSADKVAEHFSSTVDITVIDREGAYSKAQAKQVLKDFFDKNKPTSFELIHKGDSGGGSRYGIGNLSTSGGSYRVYFLLKKNNNTHQIQEIRFEKQ